MTLFLLFVLAYAVIGSVTAALLNYLDPGADSSDEIGYIIGTIAFWPLLLLVLPAMFTGEAARKRKKDQQ